MTSIERVENIFNFDKVDCVPIGEDFWEDTVKKWSNEGHLGVEESLVEHFELDLDRSGLINWYLDPSFKFETIEEDEDTQIILDGNWAKLRVHKKHASTPEHIDFAIKDRRIWLEYAKPRLIEVNLSRIPFDEYRDQRQMSMSKNRHFSLDAFGPFELMHRLCGHEILLLNMALDPEWVKDMVLTYVEFNINHWDVLLEREGLPHSVWVADDLGYKLKPFISPAMFREILFPGYKRMFDYLHSKKLKVIFHSCGYIEPLIPGLIEAGIDCLEGIEVKSGMDLLKLAREYRDHIVFFGGIDIRTLESNNYNEVNVEVNKVKDLIKEGVRYIFHSDHSISPKVEYDTFKYYIQKARQINV
ncbi:MAG: uroporphyrinogen decarboxylase family protein [Nitrososphaeria archaeon]